MADITMCPGDDCEIKHKCYRFLANKSNWQSWAMFHEQEKPCQDFWPIEKEELDKIIIKTEE